MLKILNLFRSSQQVATKEVENHAMIAEQDKKNRDYVGRIIDGHYENLSVTQRHLFKSQFMTWQALQKKMFREASNTQLDARLKCFEEKSFYSFKPHYSSDLPKQPVELFLQNVFTEPFPSTHDMDDWAYGTQTGEIMILKGITPEESKQYYVHVKNHFVNHKMTYAIIQMDIYKLSA